MEICPVDLGLHRTQVPYLAISGPDQFVREGTKGTLRRPKAL
jgi:hypothetical protein